MLPKGNPFLRFKNPLRKFRLARKDVYGNRKKRSLFSSILRSIFTPWKIERD